MNAPPKLIRNAIKTPDGTILESYSRHDYKVYVDNNGKEYMVDGGLDYLRRSAHEDQEELSLSNDEPHSIQRGVLSWGSYGINGNRPIRFIQVKDMETDHIKAVLRIPTISPVYRTCMEHELGLRY
jgi:hypothetical protein